jgi:hypothetical protein
VADLDRAVEFWCGRPGLRLLGRVTETGPDIAALLGEDAVEVEIADLGHRSSLPGRTAGSPYP